MFKRFLVLALVLGLASSVCSAGVDCYDGTGYTVMIISDSGFETMLTADDETKAEGGKYVDESLVYFLQNCGYTVDTSGMGGDYRRSGHNSDYPVDEWYEGNDGRLAALQAADLVIVSKFANSSSYARNEAPGVSTTVAWNTLGVPILTQNAHLLRGQGAAAGGGSTKWGWNNGSNGRDHQGSLATEMAMVPKNHNAYSWVCKTNLFDYSGNVGDGAKDTAGDHDGREPDLCVGDWAPGSTILGYLENDPSVWGASEAASADIENVYGTDEYQDHAILVHMAAGIDLDAFNSNGGVPGEEIYGVLGADRGFLGIWSYDGSPDYYWGQDLTVAYKNLICAVIHDMIVVPEPATIALLGLGGLALLRKKR